MSAAASTLTYDVFVNDPPPNDRAGLLPNGDAKGGSPVASTLQEELGAVRDSFEGASSSGRSNPFARRSASRRTPSSSAGGSRRSTTRPRSH